MEKRAAQLTGRPTETDLRRLILENLVGDVEVRHRLHRLGELLAREQFQRGFRRLVEARLFARLGHLFLVEVRKLLAQANQQIGPLLSFEHGSLETLAAYVHRRPFWGWRCFGG